MRELMIRAWAIYRTLTSGTHREKLSIALKAAWAETDSAECETGKQAYINRLENIIAHSDADDGCEFETVVSNWEKGDKNRTYFAIVEKSVDRKSKRYAKREYGYFDNINNTYVPGMGNLDNNFTFSGTRF